MIRQILLIASKGDTIELGLHIIPQSPSITPRVSLPSSAASTQDGSADGPVLCIFEIVHNLHQLPDSATTTPRAEINPFTRLAEEGESATPKLDSILCRRLLQQQNASLRFDTQPSSPLGSGLPRRAYELSVLLPRGKPFDEPPKLSAEEEAARQPFSTMRLAREPTLTELSDFAESLRGKRVFLHANLASLFARHLTSYLGAWGLDISHIPIDGESVGRHDSGYGGSVGSTPGEAMGPYLGTHSKDNDKFIIIDDDVLVLRRELIRVRVESSALSLRPRITKRPTLAGRARSTPHVRQESASRQPGPILIHFTSLAKYNQVRDVISHCIGTPWSTGAGGFAHPEVMVIPKPVGPRRFLTALHTAVNQPVVDPIFSPIATSPRSPGGGYFPGAWTPNSDLPRDNGFFDTVAEETSEEAPRTVSESSGSQKARSPLGEFPPTAAQVVRTETGLHLSLPTPGDILATPAPGYFSTTRSGASGASAVVMQSPDGRPLGMFFEPPAKGERRSSYTRAPTDLIRRKTVSRRTSGATFDEQVSPSNTPPSRRLSTMSGVSGATEEPGVASRRGSTREGTPGETPSGRNSRRRTLPNANTEPIIAVGRDRSSTVTRPRRNTPGSSPTIVSPKDPEGTPFHPPRPKTAAIPELHDTRQTKLSEIMRSNKDKEDVVVPPINVLIVEGESSHFPR